MTSPTGMAFTPDGETLITLDSDGLLLIWNAQTGELLNHILAVADRFQSFDFLRRSQNTPRLNGEWFHLDALPSLKAPFSILAPRPLPNLLHANFWPPGRKVDLYRTAKWYPAPGTVFTNNLPYRLPGQAGRVARSIVSGRHRYQFRHKALRHGKQTTPFHPPPTTARPSQDSSPTSIPASRPMANLSRPLSPTTACAFGRSPTPIPCSTSTPRPLLASHLSRQPLPRDLRRQRYSLRVGSFRAAAIATRASRKPYENLRPSD